MRVVTRDAEVKLIEHMNSIKEDPVGWRAIHFNFNELLDHYKSTYQMKIAINVVGDFLKEGDGGIFALFDKDIIVICKGVSRSVLDKMVFRLRYLFSDDPLAYSTTGEENDHFCDITDLSVAWDQMYEIAKVKLTHTTQIREKQSVPNASAGMESTEKTMRPLTPSRLANLENDIITADLSRVMRRQPICAVMKNKPIRRVFDEFYINIPHLRKLVMANVDLTSNRWLFTYLTETLDAKMLDMLRKHPRDYFDTPISINLNVATILSDKFNAFDAKMKPSIKVSVVIEVQVSDIFADMEAFMIAKSNLQKMGYRVCLDGVNELSFIHINREALGFDLVKLQWNSDLASEIETEKNRRLAEAIRRCGPNRIVLCRCDNKHAIDYGKAFGISLFQGRYLDNIINPDAKVTN